MIGRFCEAITDQGVRRQNTGLMYPRPNPRPTIPIIFPLPSM